MIPPRRGPHAIGKDPAKHILSVPLCIPGRPERSLGRSGPRKVLCLVVHNPHATRSCTLRRRLTWWLRSFDSNPAVAHPFGNRRMCVGSIATLRQVSSVERLLRFLTPFRPPLELNMSISGNFPEVSRGPCRLEVGLESAKMLLQSFACLVECSDGCQDCCRRAVLLLQSFVCFVECSDGCQECCRRAVFCLRLIHGPRCNES